jgi:hypothetical protein
MAEIAGQRIRVKALGNAISCVFPGGQGEFHGTLRPKTHEISGYWTQPATVNSGLRFASPVKLTPYGSNHWRGQVVPLEDEFTFFLVASAGENEAVHAFLRNPDRNLGVFLDADRLERHGDAVKLIGHFPNDKTESVLAEGAHRAGRTRSEDMLSLYFPSQAATFDFSRADEDVASSFYARGKNPGEYHYVQPMAEDDGWPVGTLAEAGISEAPIKKLIETVVDQPATSVHDFYIHGILIARRGKLVYEDYFHGFHREKPHDTRSASKSLTATLVGSVIAHGAPLNVSTPVYKTVYGDSLPADLDPHKKAMTVQRTCS